MLFPILLGNRTQGRRERILSADCAFYRNSSEIPCEIQRGFAIVTHSGINLRGQQLCKPFTGQKIVLADAGHFHHPAAIGFLEGFLLIRPFPSGYTVRTAPHGKFAGEAFFRFHIAAVLIVDMSTFLSL